MRFGISPRLLTAWLVFIVISAAADGEQPGDSIAASLHAALAKNIGHAHDLLEQRDYKSLGQTAGSIQLLAALLKSRSGDPAWQSAAGELISTAGTLQLASRDDDHAKCNPALEQLAKAATAAAKLQPAGQPQSLPKPPAIRPLMATIDGIQADAKIALITGNVDAAKKQAFVLAELSRLVSNSKSGGRWMSLADDFTKATIAAATSTDSNPTSVKQLFRGISQQCETCHENSRAR